MDAVSFGSYSQLLVSLAVILVSLVVLDSLRIHDLDSTK